MSSVVPEGWDFHPIGNHIEVLTDYTANGSFASLKENVQYFNEKNYAALVRTTDLEKDTFSPQRFTDKKGYEFLNKSSLECGDIVIANVGSAGKAYRVPNASMPMTLAPNMYLVKFYNSMDNDFAFQVITNEKFYSDLMSNVGSSTLNAINKSNFRSINISVPPLPEQKKIAFILTSVDEVIENTEKQIDKLQDLKKATMNELLTKGIGHTEFKDSELGRIPKSWEVVQLKDNLEFISYGFTNPMPETSTGVPMITAKDVVEGSINYETARNTSREAFDSLLSAKSRPLIGDILLTKDGSLGRLAIVDKEDICINQSVAVLRPNEEVSSSFLFHLLEAPLYQKIMIENAGGSTIKHIYITVVDKMKVVRPPCSEQDKIVAVLSSINKRVDRVIEKLSQTQSLKKSLMQDLLTGKVRVTVN